MAAISERPVVVFGGTGFLGRRIARHLHNCGFFVRVASRRPKRGRGMFSHGEPPVQSVEANIHEDRSVANAIAGAFGVVNAVSLYVEGGRETFHSLHVEAARRLANEATRAGVERLVHVSGIGSDVASRSLYVRKRGEGEVAVRSAFADVTLIRPAVMFGPDDAFLTVILKILRRLPIYPMFGRGLTRLQPAYVEDVAEVVARVIQQPHMRAATFECAGPRVYTYRELISSIAREANVKRLLIPMPFAAWHVMGWVAELLPSPPVTRNQVELMQLDNVSSSGMPGFAELGISPRPVEEVLRKILSGH